jgi:uncharacterized protein (DUF2252 family)
MTARTSEGEGDGRVVRDTRRAKACCRVMPRASIRIARIWVHEAAGAHRPIVPRARIDWSQARHRVAGLVVNGAVRDHRSYRASEKQGKQDQHGRSWETRAMVMRICLLYGSSQRVQSLVPGPNISETYATLMSPALTCLVCCLWST